MVDYMIALQKEQEPQAPLLWLALLFFIGVALMTIAILRSENLRWWHALAFAPASLVLVLAAPGPSGIIACALLAGFAATFAPSSRGLRRLSRAGE
jgi:hypothetical protein